MESTLNFTSCIHDENTTSEHGGESMQAKFTLIWSFVALSCIGIMGNTFSIALLTGKRRNRRKILSDSYRVYIVALAIADNGMLIFTGILRYSVVSWMYESKESSWFYEVYLCRWHRFLMHTSHNAAVWLLVVMAFDRFVAVCLPFKYRESSHSSTQALKVTSAVFGFALLFATPFLAVGPVYATRYREIDPGGEDQLNALNRSSLSRYVFNTSEQISKNVSETLTSSTPTIESHSVVVGCSLTAVLEERSAYAVNIIFHVLLAFLIPYFVLLLLNIAILRSLRCCRSEIHYSGFRPKLSRRITIMMLVVCFTFIILWLPQALILMSSIDAHSHRCNKTETLSSLAALSGLSNSALNFVLYCMTVKKFRIAASVVIRETLHMEVKPEQQSIKVPCNSSLRSIRGKVNGSNGSQDSNSSTKENKKERGGLKSILKRDTIGVTPDQLTPFPVKAKTKLKKTCSTGRAIST